MKWLVIFLFFIVTLKMSYPIQFFNELTCNFINNKISQNKINNLFDTIDIFTHIGCIQFCSNAVCNFICLISFQLVLCSSYIFIPRCGKGCCVHTELVKTRSACRHACSQRWHLSWVGFLDCYLFVVLIIMF